MLAQSVSTNVYFEDIEFEIRKLLSSAEKSVIVCVAWISWKIFSPIFSRLAEKGVVVEVMYNDDFLNKRFFVEPVGAKKFPLKVRSFSLMHNKFCIIDGKTLITGSFNWSKKASQHFENVIVSKKIFHSLRASCTNFRT